MSAWQPDHSTAPAGWLRGLLIVCAVAVPVVLSLSYFDGVAQPPATAVSQQIRPVERLGQRAQIAPIVIQSPPHVDAAANGESSRLPAASAHFARPSYVQPTSVPF